MRSRVLSWAIFSILLPVLSHAESELPPDAPVVPQVIHQLKSPLEGRHLIEGNLSTLYGDKFVSSQGFTLRDTRFFSESFGASAGVSFYRSSVTNEVEALAATGARPRTYDPSFILRATAVYQPVYGKLMIGSYILRFRLGLEGGFHAAQESYVSPFGASSDTDPPGELVLGPLAGARALWEVSENFHVASRGEFMLHSDVARGEGSRKLWELSLGVGYRL